jgi:hypothetical protein
MPTTTALSHAGYFDTNRKLGSSTIQARQGAKSRLLSNTIRTFLVSILDGQEVIEKLLEKHVLRGRYD